MKTLKRILKYICCPIVLILMLIVYIGHAIFQWLMFLRYGGEFITYCKDDRGSIEKIYKELKVIYSDGEKQA